jgi:ubiquinone/menaquinone biosynthesis C-methylase UbiE
MKSTVNYDLDLLHRRYQAQAGWTHAIRRQLLDYANVKPGDRLLEVGSGTGVIAAELSKFEACHVLGIDIDYPATCYARDHDPFNTYAVGDGLRLPVKEDVFDAVVCHFLLLWVEDPERLFVEMLRTTRPGGWVIAFAEPDYGGRIDYPEQLETTAELQIQSLETAGADPYLGRRLRSIFQAVGAEEILTGVLGAEWRPDDLAHILKSEAEILDHDLQGMHSESEISSLQALDQAAVQSGTRTLFVPTFFGMGRRSPA